MWAKERLLTNKTMHTKMIRKLACTVALQWPRCKLHACMRRQPQWRLGAS
jgi:hypothetical protein